MSTKTKPLGMERRRAIARDLKGTIGRLQETEFSFRNETTPEDDAVTSLIVARGQLTELLRSIDIMTGKSGRKS